MKDELMNVKIKFTEQSQTVAELKQEISRLETKVWENKNVTIDLSGIDDLSFIFSRTLKC
jgi:archaellum component FlaC